MKKDIKYVLVTFGLISLVFTRGYFAYQKKVYEEYLAQIKEEEIAKAEAFALAEKERILEEERLAALAKKEAEQARLAALNKTQNAQQIVTPVVPVVVSPPAPVVVTTPPPPKPQVVTVKPSRQTKAS